tara:strand:- start:1810 stop:3150 length:1341 start_codon:yes stop_codon:yes gene_type:complete
MSNIEKQVAETPFDYVLEKAAIESDSFAEGFFVDIKNVITDIEIFEHLDKPYLTGAVAFVDDQDIYNLADFGGAEKITLRFKLPGASSHPTEKVFRVEKVLKNIKTNDSTGVVVLHLIEEHAFVSSLINVNKAYTGKPSEIIQNIIKDNLGLDFSDPIVPDDQPNMRVIIPNLTAIAAALWVRNRTTSKEGLPYYLFSTLANSKIHLVDLAEMLNGSVDPNPYWYSQAYAANSVDMPVADQSYIIQNYFSKNRDEILPLIKKGLVGASHIFYDSMTGLPHKLNFNVNETFDELKSSNIVQSNQNKMSYKPEYKYNDTAFHDMVSHQKTHITSTNTYADAANYTESNNLGSHKQKIISEALRNFIVKDSIDVVLPGRNFLQGNYSNTIGNQLRLRFLNNAPDASQRDIDTKNSGDYLIYACKHTFRKERYDVMVSGVKLANLQGGRN